MKKILILSMVFLSVLGLTSCDQEEIETYSGTDNIYFSPAVFPLVQGTDVVIDSTGFSFGLDNSSVTKKIYKIPIRVQGKVSDVDRTVKVALDPTTTAVEGTHFSLPEKIVFHAGREVDTIDVTVSRTPDMKATTFTMVLNLVPNENFTTNMESRVTNVLTQKTMNFTRFKLTFDDKVAQPFGWSVPNFGVFSAKKFFLMCEVMHLKPEMFFVKPAIAEIQYYQAFMKRYLADQKASGNTVYEENGSEMIFP